MGFKKKLFSKAPSLSDLSAPLVIALVASWVDSFSAYEGLAVMLNFIMLVGGAWLIGRVPSSDLRNTRVLSFATLGIVMLLFSTANMAGLLYPELKTEQIKFLGYSLLSLVVIANFLLLVATANMKRKPIKLTEKEVKPNESTKKVFSATERGAGSVNG